MVLIFLGTSVSIFGTDDPFCGPNLELPQLQPILARVGEFLQARIDAERQRDERGTLYDSLARALDYRRWHQFTVERNQDRQWKPLSGPASSGGRALGLTVPLFGAPAANTEVS